MPWILCVRRLSSVQDSVTIHESPAELQDRIRTALEAGAKVWVCPLALQCGEGGGGGGGLGSVHGVPSAVFITLLNKEAAR